MSSGRYWMLPVMERWTRRRPGNWRHCWTPTGSEKRICRPDPIVDRYSCSGSSGTGFRHRLGPGSGNPSSIAISFSRPGLPLRHHPQHGRLFLLGLAGGVSGGNGDFRDWAVDRLLGARVPARAGRPAIRPSPPLDLCPSHPQRRPDHRHGRLPLAEQNSEIRSEIPRSQDPKPKTLVSLGDKLPWPPA